MQIKIESAVVQQAQARLRQQSGAMRAVAVNVSSVLNGLDMQIAATQQIRQSLEALSRRCTTEQTQLEAMQNPAYGTEEAGLPEIAFMKSIM